MQIDVLGCMHGYYPGLSGGDLLIITGDITARDKTEQWAQFFKWLKQQKYEKKILVAGNHDRFLEKYFPAGQKQIDQPVEVNKSLKEEFEYLCDSGTEFEGFKIWGSPYTPIYGKWSFMKKRGAEIKKHWDLIPNNTDILITHGPPSGILDRVYDENVGCEELLIAVERIKPRLHVFSHIHESHGQLQKNGISFVNASIMNVKHKPVNKPIRIAL